jgi:hypothetical protein
LVSANDRRAVIHQRRPQHHNRHLILHRDPIAHALEATGQLPHLGIGVFACAAASVKVSYLPNYGKEGDLLWDSRNITIWTAVELNVAITAASLPCLKPIFKKVLASRYGRGSDGTDRKDRSERRHWRSIPETRPKYVKGDHNESESQLVYELDRRVRAFVHDDSATTTEICQHVKEEEQCDGSVSSKVSEKGILTTTTTTVQFSLR